MLKSTTALIAATLAMAVCTPALAHFSQVFGPLKAQVEMTAAAPIKMKCEGALVTELGPEWTAS